MPIASKYCNISRQSFGQESSVNRQFNSMKKMRKKQVTFWVEGFALITYKVIVCVVWFVYTPHHHDKNTTAYPFQMTHITIEVLHQSTCLIYMEIIYTVMVTAALLPTNSVIVCKVRDKMVIRESS